jgi:hypothetical protein
MKAKYIVWDVVPCSLVKFYQTTLRHTQEDNFVSSHRRDKTKSHKIMFVL